MLEKLELVLVEEVRGGGGGGGSRTRDFTEGVLGEGEFRGQLRGRSH